MFVKKRIESSLRATSDGLFDCIVNWKPIPPEANAFVKEIMVPMSEDISVDKEGNFNGTPLMFAAYFDSNKAVTKLIERGWKTDTANKNGRTALHYGAMRGNELSCRILLQKGANIDAKDEDGKTPLILAAYRGRLNVVKLLLRSDADTQITDNYGKTAFQLAPRNCYECLEAHEMRLKN
jgi:ankyrin repeat protein